MDNNYFTGILIVGLMLLALNVTLTIILLENTEKQQMHIAGKCWT